MHAILLDILGQTESYYLLVIYKVTEILLVKTVDFYPHLPTIIHLLFTYTIMIPIVIPYCRYIVNNYNAPMYYNNSSTNY